MTQQFINYSAFFGRLRSEIPNPGGDGTQWKLTYYDDGAFCVYIADVDGYAVHMNDEDPIIMHRSEQKEEGAVFEYCRGLSDRQTARADKIRQRSVQMNAYKRQQSMWFQIESALENVRKNVASMVDSFAELSSLEIAAKCLIEQRSNGKRRRMRKGRNYGR